MPPRSSKKENTNKKNEIKRSNSEAQSETSLKDKKNKNTTKHNENDDRPTKHTKYNDAIKDQHDHFQQYIIMSQDNDQMYYCKACKSKGFYDFLAKHLESDLHLNNVSSEKKEVLEAIEAYHQFRSRGKKKKVIQIPKVTIQQLRIKITTWLLKFGIPLSKCEELINLMKGLLKEFGIDAINSLTMSSTTASKIARDCISASFKEEVFNDIQDRPFSLSFDESSDRYGPACLCTNVKYVKNGKIHNRLLSLDQIGETSTGYELHNIVMNSIFKGKENLIKENLIGVCSDKGSNMISKLDKGLTNRINKELPHVLVVHDFSHLFNLVSSYSIKKFPPGPIDLIKAISSHFGYSSLRRFRLRRIQSDMKETDFEPMYQALSYVSHRWMSLLMATERIICLWQSFEIYFDEGKDDTVNPFLNQANYAYLELLMFFLRKINFLIKFFESDSHDYPLIMSKIYDNFLLWALEIYIKKKKFGKSSCGNFDH